MLRNIIFDKGGVLFRYDPPHFIRKAGIEDESDLKLLLDNIYFSKGWKKLDLGEFEEQDVYEQTVEKLPSHLHDIAHQLIFNWHDDLEPIEGMAQLIRLCKEKGLKIYLLSNASRLQANYWGRVPGSEYFDGTVVSAFEKMVKPSPAFFQLLLDRYDLKKEECLFIDDMERNTKAAEAMGIRSFLFENDVEGLKRFILNNLDQ